MLKFIQMMMMIIMMMMTLKRMGLLYLDKIIVTSNRIFSSGALWHTRKSFKRIFFFFFLLTVLKLLPRK